MDPTTTLTIPVANPTVADLIDFPVDEHEAPLLHLLKQDPKDMTDEELAKFTSEMRQCRNSTTTRKAAAGGTKVGEKKSAPKLNISKFLTKKA